MAVKRKRVVRKGGARKGGPRTARQKAALKRAQLASARKRKGKGKRKKQPGKYINQAQRYVARGKSKKSRFARGAAIGVAAGYTPYGYLLAGSAARKGLANRKKRKTKRR